MKTMVTTTGDGKRASLAMMAVLLAGALAACGSAGENGASLDSGLAGRPVAAADAALVAPSPFPTAYTVQVLDASGMVVFMTMSDPAGNFALGALLRGSYTIMFRDTMSGALSIQTLVLTGDTVSTSGNVLTTSSTWTIVYVAPAPAPAPTPAPTPAPAPAPAPEPEDGSAGKDDIRKAELASKLSGVPVAEILNMRKSGMGWGEIAKKLGLQPGQLGLGHDNGKDGKDGKEGGKKK
jgi:hypothetical protein